MRRAEDRVPAQLGAEGAHLGVHRAAGVAAEELLQPQQRVDRRAGCVGRQMHQRPGPPVAADGVLGWVEGVLGRTSHLPALRPRPAVHRVRLSGAVGLGQDISAAPPSRQRSSWIRSSWPMPLTVRTSVRRAWRRFVYYADGVFGVPFFVDGLSEYWGATACPVRRCRAAQAVVDVGGSCRGRPH